MFSTRIKIIIGYCLLAFVLLSATWMVYDNTRSLAAINSASEKLMARRDIVDSLVYSMLETGNAERSILLGDTYEWQRFDRALRNSADKARRLRPLLTDSLKQQRLDSLVDLLHDKRQNTLRVMAALGKDNRDIFYNNKMRALQSGRDSVVIHPQTEEKGEQHETVYEIVKSRRGFFRRLGDAFRRQHSDTVGVTHISKQTDTINHHLNITDSVANALAEIRSNEQIATGKHKEIIANRNSQLQFVSIQLAWRTEQLLEDIQSDEHRALQNALNKAIGERRAMIVKIAILGLLAILSAAILVVYILRDIRRERRDRNRIIEAKAETERIMQQRERLLLTITHDIKAPAASIAGFIDLLNEYVDHPKAMGYLQSINGSAKHLLQLVSALLDYHQLESGKAELHEASFAPTSLVRECTDGMMPQALAKKLSLKTEIMLKENMMCRSDAFRIKQVVNNLVGNAIKYTDKGEVTVAVAIGNGKMTISVTDTGCGMTPEEQQRVFNAFTRLPDAQGKEGVGLGLSITREIVQRLGGSINLASRKGSGSKFTVIIPVEIVENIEGENITTIKGNENSATPITHACASDHSEDTMGQYDMQVLIVDDDSLQQQLLLEMFARIEGISLNITATTHAQEAITLAQENAPHIVFTDIEMPEMNGREIMKRIRKNNDKIKFVAITAHEPSIMPQLRSEGFDACLFKPFSVQILAATICQLTGRMVRVREEKKKDENNDIRSALLPFTDGDEEAENQIIADIRKSIDEYLEMLLDTTNTELIAKAAHKAMPLLEMLQPGKNEWLARLTPEHIGETDERERETLAKQLIEKLKLIKTSAV